MLCGRLPRPGGRALQAQSCGQHCPCPIHGLERQIFSKESVATGNSIPFTFHMRANLPPLPAEQVGFGISHRDVQDPWGDPTAQPQVAAVGLEHGFGM